MAVLMLMGLAGLIINDYRPFVQVQILTQIRWWLFASWPLDGAIPTPAVRKPLRRNRLGMDTFANPVGLTAQQALVLCGA
ncbi:hypothetical protein GCM10007972_05950 [Iodidimonas muriae]|uniref:Uncharacterized protein n=1 Tax=Iodidimonas muriae TaxID=261467 RepID=A0ABQ2L8S9_9PROT|nr:hypothetical protein JCM17843_01380 [Kordiimonadales bacterium JCM 17843]GGO07042.1 hypothetical protein GCM10007972_05950 [Iodidimonas muriae]